MCCKDRLSKICHGADQDLDQIFLMICLLRDGTNTLTCALDLHKPPESEEAQASTIESIFISAALFFRFKFENVSSHISFEQREMLMMDVGCSSLFLMLTQPFIPRSILS
jgi:hypothetical protein